MLNPETACAIAEAYCHTNNLAFHKAIGKGASKYAFLVEGGDGPAALKIADLLVSQTDRLVREAEALQLCDHPGIAHILSTQRFNWGVGHYWIVIEEYLQGGTLENLIDSKSVEHQDLLLIARKLANVLAYLYPMRLVHRDIKPANIMFRSSSVDPVLTDFGIVRVLDAPSLTQDFLQQGPGTPFYAAPEQLNNDKALIDWRTDQFCLAVSIAHCALGRHPFQTPTDKPHDAIFRVARRENLPFANAEMLGRLGLGALCKALHPWPIGRYCSPEQFVKSLD